VQHGLVVQHTNTAKGTTSGCGTQTAALNFSGADNLANSEEYDGSSWTATPSLNTGRYAAAEATAGTVSAALLAMGVIDPGTANQNATEEYNGSTWTSVTNSPLSVRQVAGAGTQTAFVSMGGYDTAYPGVSVEYDGSVWTTGGTLNTAREECLEVEHKQQL
jgi:hypothetical protein